MSKILIFSDLHLHNFKSFDYNGSRLTNGLKCLEKAFDVANQQGCEAIVFCGDLFHKHDAVPTKVLNGVIESFNEKFDEEPDLRFYYIVGNHDMYDKEGSNPLIILEQLFDNFIPTHYGERITEDIMGYGIHYQFSRENFNQQLNKPMEGFDRDRKLLFLHNTPDEFHPMTEGEFTVKDRRFKNFDHVFCGHIHQYQEMTDNFTMVGNPLHIDRSDIGQKKYFIIYDSTLKSPIKLIETGFPEFIVGEKRDNFNYWLVPTKKLEVSDTSFSIDFEDPSKMIDDFCKEMGKGQHSKTGKILYDEAVKIQ